MWVWAVICPVQAVTEDIFIRTVRPTDLFLTVPNRNILTYLLILLQLYNVVVETEQVGKKLLEKGELKRRVTFIPLNKIASTTLTNDAVKHAESLVTIVMYLLFNRTK